MTDLAEFLLARIGEDEAVAVREGVRGSTWVDFWGGVVIAGGDETVASCKLDDLALIGSEGYTYPPNPDDIATAAHIARWDPARVLAECDAKRRIVADCVAMYDRDAHIEDRGPDLADYVLAALALPYADHPDYREAWRP